MSADTNLKIQFNMKYTTPNISTYDLVSVSLTSNILIKNGSSICLAIKHVANLINQIHFIYINIL